MLCPPFRIVPHFVLLLQHCDLLCPRSTRKAACTVDRSKNHYSISQKSAKVVDESIQASESPKVNSKIRRMAFCETTSEEAKNNRKGETEKVSKGLEAKGKEGAKEKV